MNSYCDNDNDSSSFMYIKHSTSIGIKEWSCCLQSVCLYFSKAHLNPEDYVVKEFQKCSLFEFFCLDEREISKILSWVI
jgi:hypothetical protein